MQAVVDRYGSQFRSSTQHDAQEFLFWLLDKVHEDLNTATKRRYKSVKVLILPIFSLLINFLRDSTNIFLKLVLKIK